MTSGFYKFDPSGDLLYAPNAVFGSGYVLVNELHETYELPVDGWQWFDSEEAARLYYNVPLPAPTEIGD